MLVVSRPSRVASASPSMPISRTISALTNASAEAEICGREYGHVDDDLHDSVSQHGEHHRDEDPQRTKQHGGAQDQDQELPASHGTIFDSRAGAVIDGQIVTAYLSQCMASVMVVVQLNWSGRMAKYCMAIRAKSAQAAIEVGNIGVGHVIGQAVEGPFGGPPDQRNFDLAPVRAPTTMSAVSRRASSSGMYSEG